MSKNKDNESDIPTFVTSSIPEFDSTEDNLSSPGTAYSVASSTLLIDSLKVGFVSNTINELTILKYWKHL